MLKQTQGYAGAPEKHDKSINYELIRELCSYAGGLLVLSPRYLQEQIFDKISDHKDKYLKIQT